MGPQRGGRYLSWTRFVAVVIGTGIASSLTHSFFAGDWLHRRYIYPEIWREGAEGRAIALFQVTFYAGTPPNERIIYVVYYVFNPVTGHGYVYLPGRSDKWYGLNTFSIFRGEEGEWFPAWSV
jgi:hypothetical protein